MRSLSSTWTLLVALSVTGCTTGVRGSRRPRTSDPVAGAACPPAARAPVKPSEPAFVPGRIEGTPSIRVEWEALSVEQEQLANSRFHTTGLDTFGAPDLEVVLLNASFEATPDQDRENRGQIAVGRVARVPDQDMLDLIKNLDRLGFFKYAQPTASVRAFFASDRARGRITVDRDGQSVTLVSQRGLGLQAATKEIPGIYAQAKFAIQMLKNRSPSMSVKSAKVDPLHPKSESSGNGPPSGTGATGGSGR